MAWDLIIATRVHVLFLVVNLCVLSTLFTSTLHLRHPPSSDLVTQYFATRMRTHCMHSWMLLACMLCLVLSWVLLHMPGPMGLVSGRITLRDERHWVEEYYYNALRLRTSPPRLVLEYGPSGFAIVVGLWHTLFPSKRRVLVLGVSILVVVATTVSEQVPSELIFALCIGAIAIWVLCDLVTRVRSARHKKQTEQYRRVSFGSSLSDEDDEDAEAGKGRGMKMGVLAKTKNKPPLDVSTTALVFKKTYVFRNKVLQNIVLFLVVAWFVIQICADKYVWLYDTRLSVAKVLAIHYSGHTVCTCIAGAVYLMYRMEQDAVARFQAAMEYDKRCVQQQQHQHGATAATTATSNPPTWMTRTAGHSQHDPADNPLVGTCVLHENSA